MYGNYVICFAKDPLGPQQLVGIAIHTNKSHGGQKWRTGRVVLPVADSIFIQFKWMFFASALLDSNFGLIVYALKFVGPLEFKLLAPMPEQLKTTTIISINSGNF